MWFTSGPDVMPFGKHKGWKLVDVPCSYFDFVLTRMPDLDPMVRAMVERYTNSMDFEMRLVREQEIEEAKGYGGRRRRGPRR